jgi:hypothetical protein
LTLRSYIHDPVHRHLLQDKEEQRPWCVVQYASSMEGFASFVNIIHFLLPLSISIISVLFIIISLIQQKLKIGGKKTRKEHFWNQFHQHKHRLFSFFVLVISFISSYMIVVPPEFYRKEFNDATVHIKRTIQRRFRRV